MEVPLALSDPANPSRWRYVAAGAIALAALAEPWRVAVPVAVPILFGWLGVRVMRKGTPGPCTLAIFEDVLEVRGEFVVARTPLTLLRRVVERDEGFVLELPSGGVFVSRASLGGDRARLLDVLPAHVAVERAR